MREKMIADMALEFNAKYLKTADVKKAAADDPPEHKGKLERMLEEAVNLNKVVGALAQKFRCEVPKVDRETGSHDARQKFKLAWAAAELKKVRERNPPSLYWLSVQKETWAVAGIYPQI